MEEEVTKTLQLVAGLHAAWPPAEQRRRAAWMLGALDEDKIERDLIEQIKEARRPRRKSGSE
jgi:hypothetical protein